MILLSADNLLKAVCSQMPSAWMACPSEEATQGTLRPKLRTDTLSMLPYSVGQTSQTLIQIQGKIKDRTFL